MVSAFFFIVAIREFEEAVSIVEGIAT